MKKYDLSIFIPTANREFLFRRLYQLVYPWVKEHDNVQLVCAIQDDYVKNYSSHDNVKIVRGDKHKNYIKKEERRRLFNYLRGFSHCDGVYTYILEDDDIPVLGTLEKFLQDDIKREKCMYVYDIVQMEQKLCADEISDMSGYEFVEKFPEIFGTKFQWGQCITKTKLLHDGLKDVNQLLKYKPLVRMDELVTLYIMEDEGAEVSIMKYPIVWVGRNGDNYSWGTTKEKDEEEDYLNFLKKYINNDNTWLSRMIGL